MPTYSNIAELLVQEGLATVVRYRSDDENRPASYDALMSAEQKAIENQKGLHSKGELPKHRISDCTGVSNIILITNGLDYKNKMYD